ncbi:envelope stress sensor histidine kinase CpxA [Vibrio sp. S4M6]|uniref:envelope stress sensor histidine kinase CpxA n=1 Tax=Vibrio sinus TaxID=2946865 RepID=UPI00202AC1BC|nr:envelope stress sensor histidine kinase CpxA [Vibrio sinus]MCL9783525.1 envelope stress sensor histidine kinase CpxA [Vibrio sinus]
MRLPKISSLYGRIFAIFWFTMLMVLIAVLYLSHLDPRKQHNIPTHEIIKYERIRDFIQNKYRDQNNIDRIIDELSRRARAAKPGRPSLFLTNSSGTIFTKHSRRTVYLREFRNFVTGVSGDKPKQRLYGHFLIAGPFKVKLANQDLLLFFGTKWDRPPPFLLRLFDKPFQLLLAVMGVSTPFLLWLAWALSQPARKLEKAAQRVAKGEFVVDYDLEKGMSEFQQTGKSFNQMVEAVNHMISGQQRLLSDISHELRSPLTRLRMANALATRKLGESSELSRVDTEAQRLEQMIGELLELSRMQADSHLERETQPISSLWEEILSDAQFEAEQMGKALHYSPIPDLSISGNPKLLMSAVENIIRNAIYYGKDQVSINILAHQDNLHISVEDNGDGVPENEMQDIFRPFYRVSTARDRNSGGAGLGLAITESAIRQHNGTIVASRSGLGGLKVDIRLPIHH